MGIVRLDLSEYPTSTEPPKWGVSPMFWQIRWFYQTYSQDNYYKISYGSQDDLYKVIQKEFVPLFTRYGIEFNNYTSNITERLYFVEIPLEHLTDDEVFDAQVRNRYYSFSNDTVGFVIVNYGELENLNGFPDAQRYKFTEEIHSVFPNAIIVNRELSLFSGTVSSNKPELRDAVKLDEVVNIKQLLVKYSDYNLANIQLNLQLDIIEAVHQCPYQCIDASDSEYMNHLTMFMKRSIEFICLMRYNKRVYFDRFVDSMVYSDPKDAYSMYSMYANDYIALISDLPDVSVYIASEPVLLFPKRDTVQGANVRMQVFECDVDPDTWELGDNASTQSYSADQIDMLSASKLFKLDSENIAEAKAGMETLQGLLNRFSIKCKAVMDMSSVLLNISNVLFYTIDGTIYIAYIAYLHANTNFEAYLIRQRSKPFEITLDVTDVTLRDVRLYDDWKRVLAPYFRAGLIRKEHMFFRPTRYLNGLCARGIQTNGLFTEKCGLTFEEIGMYSEATWPLRQTQVILEHLKRDFVAENIATPFGGLHPMIGTSVRVDKEAWRSDEDKFRQFNTYGY